MRPIICAAAFLLAATTAHAQIPCGPTGEVLSIAKDLGLEPLYGGASLMPRGAGILLANKDSGHWIVIIVDGETTCVLVEGADGQVAKLDTGV